MKKLLLLLFLSSLLSSCLKWQTCEVYDSVGYHYMTYKKFGQSKKKFKRECEARNGVVK
ncbi:MAG: hypothetical protein JNL60_17070 [Bacteroidia bacterium]|nr:hypothetical protein [Bacteroidia bacterium]